MRAVVIAVILFASGAAHAQIVNVQGALAKVPEGVSGSIEAKVAWQEGNNQLLDLGATGTILVKDGRFIGLALARGGYAESRDTLLSKKSFEHLRTRISLGKTGVPSSIDCRWKWEVFAQHEFDQFKRLTLRAVAGTGPAFQIVESQSIGLLAGAAYLAEYERLDRREGTIDAGAHIFEHRASLYLTGREQLATNVSIIETIYVQPRLDEPSDVRVLGELALQTKLSTRIALTNGFTVAYDHSPPDGIRTYDTELKVGVVVTF